MSLVARLRRLIAPPIVAGTKTAEPPEIVYRAQVEDREYRDTAQYIQAATAAVSESIGQRKRPASRPKGAPD